MSHLLRDRESVGSFGEMELHADGACTCKRLQSSRTFVFYALLGTYSSPTPTLSDVLLLNDTPQVAKIPYFLLLLSCVQAAIPA